MTSHYASMDVGKRISSYRRLLGVSQQTLAVAIGRTGAWVSSVERGVFLPSEKDVANIAATLGINSDSLLNNPAAFKRRNRP